MWRHQLSAVLSTLVLVTGCAGTTATEPETVRPAPGGLPPLYFSKNGSLYVSDPVGDPPRKLTAGPGDTDPAPSPDGRSVAYVHQVNPEQSGGELRVLDIASGNTRRLVDPADLEPTFEGDEPTVTTPRWSPAGDRIAFLKATLGGGGFLLTAAVDTGEVTAPPEPLFADFGYAWSPDGRTIVWVGGRSDVSPVDVAVYPVGGTSTTLVSGTNAMSVSYAADGSVVFANAEVTGSAFLTAPFALRDGGLYTVRAGEPPVPLLSGPNGYADVQALPSGAVAFTVWSADDKSRTIGVLEDGHTRELAETPGDAPPPVWCAERGEMATAYVGTAPDRPLLVHRGSNDPTRIDSGVDAFAWGSAQTGG